MKNQDRSFLVSLVFLVVLFVSKVNGQCGNNFLNFGEECDTGSFVGLLVNDTCCTSNCTLRASNVTNIYNYVYCTSNGDCDDNYAFTTDTCDLSNGRCTHFITNAFYPCSGSNTNTCPFSTCRQPTSCTSSTCRYGNGGTGGEFYNRFTRSHCLNESMCSHSFNCAGAQDSDTNPSIGFTKVISGSTLTCNQNYSWAQLFSTAYVAGSTLSIFGSPDYTLTVSDGGTGATHCFHTMSVIQTGPTTGYVYWGVPYKYGFDNQCTLTITATPNCPGQTQLITSQSYVFTVPNTNIISGFECSNTYAPFLTLCNDGIAASTDTCDADNLCYHDISGAARPVCSAHADCPFIPCQTQRCSGGRCEYDNINSGAIPPPLTGSYCTNETACGYDLHCLNGAVAFTKPAELSDAIIPYNYSTTTQTMNSPHLRCQSTTYVRDLFADPSTLSPQSSTFGHPGFAFVVNTISCIEQTVTYLNQNTNDAQIVLSGPYAGGVFSDGFCTFGINWRYDCANTPFTFPPFGSPGGGGGVSFQYYEQIDVPIVCCGNARMETNYGEECDLGNFITAYGMNNLSTSCCAADCTLEDSSKLCYNATGDCENSFSCLGTDGPAFSLIGGIGRCPSILGPLLKNSTQQCAVSVSPCTVNMTCNGINASCPDNFVPAGNPCNTDSNICTVETCDVSHVCNAQSNTSYSDGFYCNGVETCDPLTGLSTPGTPINCDDDDSCTTDSCDEQSDACIHTPIAESTGPCGTSNVGVCQYGTKSCDGTGPSPVITCVGAIEPSPELCEPPGFDENCDGTVDENCVEVGCVDDSDCSSVVVGQCQTAVCDILNSVCILQNKTIGTLCDTGLGCMPNGQCGGNGLCVGTPLDCDDEDPCTRDTCVEPGTCVHNTTGMLGTPCVAPDSNCTENGSCDNFGTCVPGAPVTCPPTGEQCTVYQCDVEVSECVLINVTGSCNDQLSCFVNETCTGDECIGIPVNCDDGISCTADSCVEPSGICIHPIMAGTCYISGVCYEEGNVNPSNPCQVCNASRSTVGWSFTTIWDIPCDDEDLCTDYDSCNPDLQVCVGEPRNCTYLDGECIVGVCDELDGNCYEEPRDNSTACDFDGDPCTLDHCADTECVMGPTLDCSYLDTSCDLGLCNSMNGLCYINSTEECLEFNCTGGCTRGHEYWEEHVWPDNATRVILCGKSWRRWLHSHDHTSLWKLLAKEYITMQLNSLNGACMPTALVDTNTSSLALLELCYTTSDSESVDAAMYEELTLILSLYNDGTYGPGRCPPPLPDGLLWEFLILFFVLLALSLCCCWLIFFPYPGRRRDDEGFEANLVSSRMRRRPLDLKKRLT